MKKLEQTATGGWELEWETPAYPVPTEPPQLVEKTLENVGEVQNLADVERYEPPRIIYVPQVTRTPQYNSPLISERTQETAGKVLGATLIAALIGGFFIVLDWVLSVLATGFLSLASIAKSIFEILLYGIGAVAVYWLLRSLFQGRGSSSEPTRPYRNEPTTGNGNGQQNITININGGGNQQINRY